MREGVQRVDYESGVGYEREGERVLIRETAFSS